MQNAVMDDDEVLAFMRQLIDAGYAVAIFTPEEVGAANPNNVMELMIEKGWELIDTENADNYVTEEERS